MASNIMLVVFMIITILLLFTTMIFSAMAADKSKDCKANTPGSCGSDAGEKCHKNSMYAALITGLSAGLLGVCLIIYIYTSKDTMKEEMTGAMLGKFDPETLSKFLEASKKG